MASLKELAIEWRTTRILYLDRIEKLQRLTDIESRLSKHVEKIQIEAGDKPVYVSI